LRCKAFREQVPENQFHFLNLEQNVDFSVRSINGLHLEIVICLLFLTL
jgi:hypothetical protein